MYPNEWDGLIEFLSLVAFLIFIAYMSTRK